MKITITCPTETLTFDAEVINIDSIGSNTLTVTVIDPEIKMNQDYVFSDFIVTKTEEELIITASAVDIRPGFFTMVCFLNPSSVCLMDVFEQYDGDIVAYDDGQVLNAPRREVPLEHKIHVITSH